MKPMRVKMTDANGVSYFWTVKGHKSLVLNEPGKKRPRLIHGWMFVDHEGCQRVVEGNWLELVARFHGVAENYGLTSNLS
jgi:hypothetical protein